MTDYLIHLLKPPTEPIEQRRLPPSSRLRLRARIEGPKWCVALATSRSWGSPQLPDQSLTRHGPQPTANELPLLKDWYRLYLRRKLRCRRLPGMLLSEGCTVYGALPNSTRWSYQTGKQSRVKWSLSVTTSSATSSTDAMYQININSKYI